MDGNVYSYKAVLMGSPILLKLFINDEKMAGQVFNLIRHYEDIFTVNRDKSEVMDINHAAGTCSVSVSAPVYELIKYAKSISMMPGSLFNVAIGPLVKRWKIGFKGDKIPPDSEIQSLLYLARPDHIILNDSARSVLLANFGMELDLGGIAKGYIADRVRDYLKRQGVEYGLINLGGNVNAMSSPLGDWAIGLKKPFAGPEDVVGIIHVNNKSVVTSGIYERYFEQNGRLYHHILNPRTGYPLDNELYSVTIVSTDSIDGDVFATVIYGMGVKKGLEFLKKRDDMEAIFLTKQNELIFSSRNNFTFTLEDKECVIVDDNEAWITQNEK